MFDGQSQKYEYQARKDGVPLVSDIWDQYVKLLLSARFSHFCCGRALVNCPIIIENYSFTTVFILPPEQMRKCNGNWIDNLFVLDPK